MGNREANKQEMKQKIFDAALTLFCENGYLNTTLMDIAQEAEVSTRTLYNYYPTKEALLREFGEGNIADLATYAKNLPADMLTKEKVLSIMTQDYSMMFCLFDISFILHSARDKNGVLRKFEMKNILSTQRIYRDVFRDEQQRKGVEPNELATLCAMNVVGIYRHCADIFRFVIKGNDKPSAIRKLFEVQIDLIWDSLMEELLAVPTKEQKDIMQYSRLFELGSYKAPFEKCTPPFHS